ncbi:MAG: hypothetical protein IJE07_04475 [Clostridia bacterium]|nr:hypothetical protein [Clostridia bacterium]
MQHLCLCGSGAPLVAEQLFSALNVQPVGLRILPFTVDGAPRGDALWLLPPPPLNGVPCRIRIAPEDMVIVPRVMEEVAAPGLRAALRLRTPMLLSGLRGDVLANDAFRRAVCDCLQGDIPLVLAGDDSAKQVLGALLPPDVQFWVDVPEDAAAHSALLEQLIPEAALRF